MGERWTGEVIGREDKEGGGKGMDEVWDRGGGGGAGEVMRLRQEGEGRRGELRMEKE